MDKRSLKLGLTAGLLVFGFGLSGAEASVNRPLPNPLAANPAVTPAAFCVYPGGRFFRVPGPPWVCRRYGAFPAGPRPHYGGGYYGGYGAYGPRPYWGGYGMYGPRWRY